MPAIAELTPDSATGAFMAEPGWSEPGIHGGVGAHPPLIYLALCPRDRWVSRAGDGVSRRGCDAALSEILI